MALRSDVLNLVHDTAQRVRALADDDARDLAWWVLRIAPALDRLAAAQHAVRSSTEPTHVGRATDARDEAVHQLVQLLGRAIAPALSPRTTEP